MLVRRLTTLSQTRGQSRAQRATDVFLHLLPHVSDHSWAPRSTTSPEGSGGLPVYSVSCLPAFPGERPLRRPSHRPPGPDPMTLQGGRGPLAGPVRLRPGDPCSRLGRTALEFRVGPQTCWGEAGDGRALPPELLLPLTRLSPWSSPRSAGSPGSPASAPRRLLGHPRHPRCACAGRRPASGCPTTPVPTGTPFVSSGFMKPAVPHV